MTPYLQVVILRDYLTVTLKSISDIPGIDVETDTVIEKLNGKTGWIQKYSIPIYGSYRDSIKGLKKPAEDLIVAVDSVLDNLQTIDNKLGKIKSKVNYKTDAESDGNTANFTYLHPTTVSGSFKTKTSQSTDGLNLIQEILLEIQKKSNELIEKAEEYSVWAYSRFSFKK